MMDCNKEEAYRAREIAEKKMQNSDFNGARKIAEKAQRLFPELENILRMLTVCEVHCAANVKVNGEVDWYGVLQLGSTADDSSIKKQYRKLALLLHPDKNQFAGAETAFKIIGEAHMILSDRTRRHLYDTRRNAITKSVHSKQSAPQSDKSAIAKKKFSAFHTKGFHPHHQQSPPPSSFDTSQTFWTICPGCGTRYQLFCSILKKFIRCQKCLIPFVAFQSNAKDGFGIHKQVPVQTTNKAKPKRQTGNPSFSKGFKERDGGVGSSNEVKLEKTSLSEFHQPEKDPKPPKRNVDMNRGKKGPVKSRYSDKTNNEDDPIANISSSPVPRRSARHMQNPHFNEVQSEDDNDFINHSHHKKLKTNTSSEGHKPVYFCSGSNHLKIGADSTNSADVCREKKQKECAHAKEKVPCVNKGVDKDPISGNKEDTTKPGTSSKSGLDSVSNTTFEHYTFMYPDTEFFDFEKLKDVNEFAVDQIWAVYDNLDGMPRFYAQIHRINTRCFKLWFTWLEHIPSNEAETAWSDADLPVGCGNYELGSSDYAEDRLMFSHMISWEKKKRKNSYSIYPRKGEVWALFKDWSIGWSLVADNKLFEYEVVLVLSDFDGSGICVVPLLKIEGFISLFVQAKEKSFVIPIDETLKFSHKIPSYRLTGKEKEGIPQGCLELDPASLPLNFSNTFPSVSLTERIEKLDPTSNPCLNCTSPEEPRINMVLDVECKLNVKQNQAAENQVKQNQTSENHHSGAQSNTKSDTQHAEVEIKQKDGLADKNLNYSSKENFKLPLFKFHEAKFHNFGEGKSIENLQRGQIWALRGDTDKYPKNYAWLKKIFSEGVLHMGCLEACPVFDEEIRWVEEGMPISCGKFKVKQLSIITVKLDMLSHPVQAIPVEKRKRYLILPSCGEIWAVYKNWNVGWRLSDLHTCEYDVVEICECTDAGFRVRPLKSVQGYRAILKPELEGKTMEIPIHESTRFSHKIPSFPLTIETEEALQDCWQVDTASLPE
ncbi:uncharacterized protein LOC122053272 [Zingiber officinale]|uniref:J domain-containing protein n=1 Tax=Zingiber officinale TaxID=94328 RepID=A0A8J5H879_ZINOF|nr:uncharacterized protein LOC122053272 [Zingiber officinale]XP_042471188.1 uncharacterized protein LOC122053272 [Zingiber officinale]KAG6522879.1 hypothetical protein ZIOFF_020034 [Zingiber officinale]